MSILWCTSFNEEIYKASGNRLLKSFEKTKTEGNIFIGIENPGEEIRSKVHGQGYLTYFLDESFWLKKWLEDNKDISPPNPCLCKDPWARSEKDHVKGCPHTWFNRNTYRWIKKIATMYEAICSVADRYDYLIWIDADCEFIDKLTERYIDDLMFENGRYDMLYLKSHRSVLEAGFHAYNLTRIDVKFFFDGLFTAYSSGNFRKLNRWDDSYVIQKVMVSMPGLVTHDIAFSVDIDNHSGVFSKSMLQHHIVHNKGRHGRQLGIMK